MSAAEEDEIDLPVRHGVGLGILRALDERIRENLFQLQMERWGDHSTRYDDLLSDWHVYVVNSPTLYGAVDDGRDRVSTVDHVARKDTIDHRLGWTWMMGIPEGDQLKCVAGRDYKFFLLAFENVETDHDWYIHASKVEIVEECDSHYDATRLARDKNERATAEIRQVLQDGPQERGER